MGTAARNPLAECTGGRRCYRRQDTEEVVDRIYDDFVREFGGEAIFRDIDAIPLGEDFVTYIQKSLRNCYVVLVFIGRDWTTCTGKNGQSRLSDPDDHVRLEIETAISLPDVQVIPMLVKNAKMPERGELPNTLHAIRRLNGAAIRPVGTDYKTDIGRLVKNLREKVERVTSEKRVHEVGQPVGADGQQRLVLIKADKPDKAVADEVSLALMSANVMCYVTSGGRSWSTL